MNLNVDNEKRISLNNVCIGKMDLFPSSDIETEKGKTRCFIQIMDWIVERHLQKTTVAYLLKRIGDRRTPELWAFRINGEMIFENQKTFDSVTPVVQFLFLTMEFATEFVNQQDRMWLILSNLEKSEIGVERKINVLSPKLKGFILERREGRGPSSTDFHQLILPCFKAIIRDLMGVGKR